MENENKVKEEIKKDGPYPTPVAVAIVGVLILGAIFYSSQNFAKKTSVQKIQTQVSTLEESVLPTTGVTLPVTWGNLGTQLVSTGTIDADKFKAIYENRGTFTDEYRNLLLGENNGKIKIKINSENSGYILNLFWALGLGNKNAILENGPMMDPKYGGAGNFASTGGWTIAKGNAMNHYSQHVFFSLTSEQQALVERVAKNIYRPCCGNSTYFPDCNHGMAMLGLLELMASQGVSEQDMWKTALAVNSYWFPDTYLTIATYMKNGGVEWKDVNPQEILGANYSSGQGFAQIASQVTQPVQKGGGSGCGVGAEAPVQQRQQSGCGVGAEAPIAAPAPKQQSGCGI